jgi:hypothetical protein
MPLLPPEFIKLANNPVVDFFPNDISPFYWELRLEQNALLPFLHLKKTALMNVKLAPQFNRYGYLIFPFYFNSGQLGTKLYFDQSMTLWIAASRIIFLFPRIMSLGWPNIKILFPKHHEAVGVGIKKIVDQFDPFFKYLSNHLR